MATPNTELHEELTGILLDQRITTLFQPIYELSRQNIFAFEALTRGPEDTALHFPDNLFAVAKQCDRLTELEHICQERAIHQFRRLQLSGKLTINIDPHALIEDGHTERTLSRFLDAAGLSPDRIILELTEHSRTDCYAELKKAVREHRDMGFDIAMDDLSAGYSNLRLLSDLEPEFVKLDKYFISRIDDDDVAEDFVRTIVSLARRVKCKVIAEGIETASQLRHLHRLGVEYAQGYLLGRPAAEPEPTVPAVLMETIHPMAPSYPPTTSLGSAPADEQVASLNIQPTPVCTPDTSAFDALGLFQADPLLHAIPVLDGERAVGLLTREAILGAFALTFGHSLHRRSQVEKMMHLQPLTAQIDDTLSDISRQATARPFDLIYAPIIVFDGNHYMGTATIHDLLEKITKVQVSYALDASPLTGLPGNRSIDREVSRRLRNADNFFLCHLDLDNFKAFNDRFGYERGDEMIMLIAELLRQAQGELDYIGHIGGDDFVFITTDDKWQSKLQDVLDTFAQVSHQLYDDEECKAGFIRIEDRAGKVRDIPLVSLSVGALPCTEGRFSSHLEAAEAVFEVKCLAKKQAGNSIVIDRRKCVSSCSSPV